MECARGGACVRWAGLPEAGSGRSYSRAGLTWAGLRGRSFRAVLAAPRVCSLGSRAGGEDRVWPAPELPLAAALSLRSHRPASRPCQGTSFAEPG